jgi:hypothetical protein
MVGLKSEGMRATAWISTLRAFEGLRELRLQATVVDDMEKFERLDGHAIDE